MCHFIISRCKFLTGVILSVAALFATNAYAFSLKQAESLATQSDPSIESYKATARAFVDKSIADDSLPDPKLRIGAVNVPVDTFKLGQVPMTQVKVGVIQSFPRGDLLSLKQKQSEYLSNSALAMADDASLEILRDVRISYLNLFYEISSYQIVLESRKLFSELVKITESNYAAGRVNQQDVVLAGLELSRLEDRSTKILAREEGYRAMLAQWIGDVAWTEISKKFPVLPELPNKIDLNSVIPKHPLIHAEIAKINASKQMTKMAQQEYKPGWSLLLDYGFRSGDNLDGTERADLATALVSLDIPLFTGNRQDKNVSSNQQMMVAAQYAKDDKLRKLKQSYEKNKHLWQRLGEREKLYKNSLLISAKNNSKASLKAYRSGVSEFDTLMRAQITELDVRLENVRVRVDRAVAQAWLLYVIGGFNNE